MKRIFGVSVNDDIEYNNILLKIMVKIEHTTANDFSGTYTINEAELLKDAIFYIDTYCILTNCKLIVKIIKSIAKVTERPLQEIKQCVINFIENKIKQHLEDKFNEKEILNHFACYYNFYKNKNVKDITLSNDKKNIYCDEYKESSDEYKIFFKTKFGFNPFAETYTSDRIKKINEITQDAVSLINFNLLSSLEDEILLTDENYTKEEKIIAMNNTIKIIKESIISLVTNVNTDILKYIINNPTDPLRPTKQIGFFKLIKDTNINIISKDSKNRFFYPYIVDLLTAVYWLKFIYEEEHDKFKDALKIPKSLLEKECNPSKSFLISLDFFKHVKKNQIPRYVIELFANRKDLNYKLLRRVLRQLLFESPSKQKNFAKEKKLKIPPIPITDITEHTS